MCALISAADGSIDPAERRRTAALIASNDVLSVFPSDELRQTFDGYCDRLERDVDFGREAVATIGRLRSKPGQARAVVSIGLIIGTADGVIDESEKAAVRAACSAFGTAPAEFDL